MYINNSFEVVVKRILEQGARLSYGRKWLTLDVGTNQYDIWGQEYHQTVHKIISTESIVEAVAHLANE